MRGQKLSGTGPDGGTCPNPPGQETRYACSGMSRTPLGTVPKPLRHHLSRPLSLYREGTGGAGAARDVLNHNESEAFSMTVVVGVDPSLTATGIAGAGHALCWAITHPSKGHNADTLAERDKRLARITDTVAEHASGARLVVIEGPALSRGAGSSTWDRAGLWWRIVHRLHAAEIPVAVCPPSTRCKWATGRGNADKAAVAVAVARMWPAATLDDDNQADALALATMGMQWAESTFYRLERHSVALRAVKWPIFGAGAST